MLQILEFILAIPFILIGSAIGTIIILFPLSMILMTILYKGNVMKMLDKEMGLFRKEYKFEKGIYHKVKKSTSSKNKFKITHEIGWIFENI